MISYKNILFFSLLSVVSFSAKATPMVSTTGENVRLTSFPIEYFIDNTQALSYQEVKQQTFSETTNTTSLGTKATVTWYRIMVHNPDAHTQNLFLHLPKAYHLRSAELFEEAQLTPMKQALINLNSASNHPLMYRGTVVYPFSLAAGKTVTLYLRSHVYSHQWFAAEIYNDEHSRKALVGGYLDIALLVGMLLALVFYNGLLYLATKQKENIFYSFYLISGLIWIALSYGLIGQVFNAYGDTVFKLNLSVFAMPIFLLLFMMAIFETRKFHPKEHLALQAILAVLVCGFIYGVYDITAALKHASSLALLMMIVTFSVSFSLFRKGNPLVKFFLIGHTFFVLFNVYAVSYYVGETKPNYLNVHGVGLGIVLEALTLAFIISYRIRMLETIRSKQDELKRLASTDPLTQLFNRRYFSEQGKLLIETAAANSEPVAIIMLDIDHFKSINDQYGHQAGDLVLEAVAKVLQQFSRGQDLVARFGGEEFVLLIPGTNYEAAKNYAERIRRGVEELYVNNNDGAVLHVTISLGVAMVDTAKNESLETATNRADKALYQAKQQGRNRACGAECVPFLQKLKASM